MGALRKHMLTFDQFCIEVKERVFGYENINPNTLLDVYDDMLEKAEEADKLADKMFQSLGLGSSMKFDDDDVWNMPHVQERIKNGTFKYIEDGFKDKTLQKDKYCLKENIMGVAVQMKNNEDMLGFITELVEGSSRFVMVDFGDAEGAVKIDIEELNY